jgi:hypothetical protein
MIRRTKRNINEKIVYNNSDIIQLKSKLGINTIMNSVNTLSDAVHALITNRNPRNKTNQNVQSKAKPTATVTRRFGAFVFLREFSTFIIFSVSI